MKTPSGRTYGFQGVGLGSSEWEVEVDGRTFTVSFQGDHKHPYTGLWVAYDESAPESFGLADGNAEVSAQTTDQEMGVVLDAIAEEISAKLVDNT